MVVDATGTVAYTVRRTGGKTGQVSVDYETVDGSAEAGSDFVAASGTLTWNDGDVDDKTMSTKSRSSILSRNPVRVSICYLLADRRRRPCGQ